MILSGAEKTPQFCQQISKFLQGDAKGSWPVVKIVCTKIGTTAYYGYASVTIFLCL